MREQAAWQRALVATIAIAWSTIGHTQQITNTEDVSTTRAARPKVTEDESYYLGRGGYPVRVFFEEGTEFGDGTANVYYEPLLYVLTDEEGQLRHKIKDKGELILYLTAETDSEFMQTSLREHLRNTARTRLGKPLYGGEYRINPLPMQRAWVESSRRTLDGSPTLMSAPISSHSMAEMGKHQVYFVTKSKEMAAAFVNELQEGDANLVFRYSFSGVADNVCTVRLVASNIRQMDLFKEVKGEGKVGYISRAQAVELAGKIANSENVRARCDDWTVGKYLIDQLMKRVTDHTQRVEVDHWADFQDLVAFDTDSLKADVVREIKSIEKESIREELLRAMAQSETTAQSEAREAGAIGAGFGVVLGGSASEAESHAESTTQAMKAYEEIVKSKGILGEWRGTRYVPKSIDLYTTAGLEIEWERDMVEEYRSPVGRTQTHPIVLTKAAWTDTEDAAAVFRKREESRVEQIVAQLREELQRESEKVAEKIERISMNVADANTMAAAAQSAGTSAAESARAAHEAAGDAERTAKETLRRMKAISVRIYVLKIESDTLFHKYATGQYSRTYPAAVVAESYLSGCSESHKHTIPGSVDIPGLDIRSKTKSSTTSDNDQVMARVERRQWYIYLKLSSDSCDYLVATVLFLNSDILKTWASRTHKHWKKAKLMTLVR